MTDWANGIETRNYGIKNEIDANMLSGFIRTIIPLMIIAGAFLFCSWVRSQLFNVGYEISKLSDREKALIQTRDSLNVEEESLKRPGHIDDLARNDMGMIPICANQLISPEIQDVEKSPSNVIAMSQGNGLEQELR
jgi:hypothetical protein